MAFSWAAAVCNALANAMADYFVGGIGKWYTSVPAEICSFTFTGDGFSSASSGVVTNTTMTVGTNSTGSSKTIASLRVFEDDGTLHIARGGLRACFDVSTGQSGSAKEQNKKTAAVLTGLGMRRLIGEALIEETSDDDDTCPHCGR